MTEQENTRLRYLQFQVDAAISTAEKLCALDELVAARQSSTASFGNIKLSDFLSRTHGRIVGLSPDLRVFGGYDSQHDEAAPNTEDLQDQEPLPLAEKLALADLMLER